MEDQRNIILCGFMGSGKTTLGRLLAKRLDRRFQDMDDYIVAQAGMPVAEIFRRFGEAEFREREHQAALALSGERGLVLATGGGALTYRRNVDALRETGLIVFLNPGFRECYRRIASSDRPLVRANSKEQLEELYRERETAYRKAAHRELMMKGSPGQWAEALARLALEE